MKIDVQELDCDFYCFSGHKLYGPSGIGVLFGKEALLESMPPYQGGGDMIRYVTLERSDFNTLPYKFEAGTPNIADTIGLGAAIDYLDSIGMERVACHERMLLSHATERANATPNLKIIGTSTEKGALLSFTLKNIHPHDIGTLLDFQGIAIRAGHHCAMPVMDFFQVPATARASFGMYNTIEEVDQLFLALEKTTALFK
jgi:cysteine desulfurase/selenocysteine lyase